jgi:hypothetical protein
MKNVLGLFLLIILAVSCQKKETTDVTNNKQDSSTCSKKEKKFEMYQMSEMASLMEQMYAYNKQIKDRIVRGDTVGKFPEFFNKIYTAKFTTPSDNDAFFKEHAKKYITAQKLIYSDPKNVKENFNKGLDACVTCHQGKCGGPIPRIKKLYIK